MPLSPEEQQHITELVDHPGWKALRERAKTAQVNYYIDLGRTLYANPGSVTEAALYEKQMFFRGIWWLLNKPLFAAKDLEREFSRPKGEVIASD